MKFMRVDIFHCEIVHKWCEKWHFCIPWERVTIIISLLQFFFVSTTCNFRVFMSNRERLICIGHNNFKIRVIIRSLVHPRINTSFISAKLKGVHRWLCSRCWFYKRLAFNPFFYKIQYHKIYKKETLWRCFPRTCQWGLKYEVQ